MEEGVGGLTLVGFGDRYGVVQCSYYGGWGSFGTDIGDVNIVGGLG